MEISFAEAAGPTSSSSRRRLDHIAQHNLASDHHVAAAAEVLCSPGDVFAQVLCLSYKQPSKCVQILPATKPAIRREGSYYEVYAQSQLVGAVGLQTVYRDG